MNKNNVLKPILFVVVGLVAGILIGMAINGFPPQDNELAGSIGKVDNQRNVRITEDDILLRNELAEDTARLLQYQRYSSYIYYKSLKSSADIERVISLTADNQEFIKSLNLTQTLEGYLTYLDAARADLLTALHALENPDMDKKVPIIQYLINVQNAASRIYSNEGIFLSYMDGIEAWLAAHPEQNNQNLKEAHDLLALNMLQSALITQDKPTLKYLDDKKLYSDNQTLKTVLSDTVQKAEMMAFIAQDNAGIENFNEQGSQKIVKSMEQLSLVNSCFASSFLRMITFNDVESLKFGFLDQQKLAVVNDQQKLGLFSDPQALGGVFILDQQSLGTILFDMQMVYGEALGEGGCAPFCP